MLRSSKVRRPPAYGNIPGPWVSRLSPEWRNIMRGSFLMETFQQKHAGTTLTSVNLGMAEEGICADVVSGGTVGNYITFPAPQKAPTSTTTATYACLFRPALATPSTYTAFVSVDLPSWLLPQIWWRETGSSDFGSIAWDGWAIDAATSISSTLVAGDLYLAVFALGAANYKVAKWNLTSGVLEGRYDGASGITTARSLAIDTYICNEPGASSGRYWDGKVYWFGGWSRQLQWPEIAYMAQNPFMAVDPKIWMRTGTAAAAGGGSVPVFYHHRQTQGMAA